MAGLDRLAPEQKAVLQLILAQGKSYDEIADLLGIDGDAVRARAHTALDRLGPEGGRRLTPARRGEISDYLLGQDDDVDRRATREYLADSAGARAWARVVASELRPAAPDSLPPIPAEGAGEPAEDAPAPARGSGALARSGPRSSRRGGAILLGVLGVAAIVGILALAGVFSSDDGATKTTTQDAGAAPRTIAQINLLPTTAAGKNAAGLARVVASGNQKAMVIAGQGVGAGTFAVWLYSSEARSKLLGFVPTRVGKNGRFAARSPYPDDASRYRELVVSKEPVPANAQDLPKSPATIVLRGKLA
jgi:Sigma-70, region 4